MAATMKFQFEPERVAYYEANGWRAYYERKWFQVIRLIVGLCQEQFHIPFPMSVLAGFYTARASAAWVPADHDERKVLSYLEKFYRIARRYSGLEFDPERVAQLELQYFDVHRRLVGAENKGEFVETLVQLHSAIFGLPAEAVRKSAELRVRAADIVDLITGKLSNNIEEDWAKLEVYLCLCYHSLQLALAS